MYEENTNKEQNMNSDEHNNSNMGTPDFTMKDPEPVQNQQQGQASTGAQTQGSYNWQNQQTSGNQQAQYQNGQSAQNQQAQYQNSQPVQNQQVQYQNSQSVQNQQSGQAFQNQQTQYQDSQAGQQAQTSQSGFQGGFQNHQPSEEHHEKRRKNGLTRKVAGITAAALLFGTVSGGTMVGINKIADSFGPATYPLVSSQAAVEDSTTEAQTSASASASGNSAVAGNAAALDVSAIAKSAMPSVVAINNTMLYQSNNWWGMSQTYEVPSSGSGIIIGQNDEELLIATNNHVVEDSENLSVVFIDDTSVNASIKGTDADSDLAVIAVALKDIPEDTLSQISVAKLGDSDALEVGQGVVAIGNALGYGQSVTVGYVSALNREVKVDNTVTRNLLQTDAAINPGNSGGALLNMKGEVIGINAAKYSSTDVEGIGYAIPISKAQEILSTLMTQRTKNQTVAEGEEGYLGIQGLTVDDSMVKQQDMPAGVFVYGIIDGGAAANSDLRKRDIIVKFDGQSVKSMAALQDLLKYYKAGETVELGVKSLENGEYVDRTVTITLGTKATLGQDAQNGNSQNNGSQNGNGQAQQ
ncbi:MAG: trypsin-like peptidase domain-containing protein [Lachnospiraceae bacterium]|nr:trypsin-like peptidase domain-containing protein [Lachnospiraceae bacterium]